MHKSLLKMHKLPAWRKQVRLLEDTLRLERARRYDRSSEQYVDPEDRQCDLFDEVKRHWMSVMSEQSRMPV